jgi:F-type H+-transporting ATPase subunit b
MWVFLIGVFLWSLAGLGWAAEAHHSELNLWDELFRWINFVVLAAILYKVLSKQIPRVLQERRQTIQQAMENAQASRAQAERLLQDNQRRTANLQQELAELQAQASREREELTQRMEAEAQQLAARIIAQARTEIERATERARLSLREEAAALTVQLAEEILRQEVHDTEHQALVRRYIARIGELN